MTGLGVGGVAASLKALHEKQDRFPAHARLLEPKPAKIATVALANKTARITWAVMTRKEVYTAAA